MKIEWITLLGSIALLWMPYPLPRGLNERLSTHPPARPRSPTFRGIARVWSNWLSLVAAYAGAFLLAEMALDAEPGVRGAGIKILAIQAVILTFGVLIHTVRIKSQWNFFAPCAYLSGVTLALGGWASGGFAVAVGLVFAAVQASPVLQLPISAVVLGISWYLLGGISLYIFALNVGLLLLPHFISLMLGSPLLVVATEKRHAVE